MKKITMLCTILTLVLVLFAGCGSSQSSSSFAASSTPGSDAINTAAASAKPSPSPKTDLDLIVGKYVGMYSMSSGDVKGVTFDISKGADGSCIAREDTYPIAAYPKTHATSYSCEVSYKDGCYNIKEISKTDSNTTSSMSYYRLTMDGDVLQGDNVKYSDGTAVGKIAIKRADSFGDLAGSYTGSITSADKEVLQLDIVIQQASDGTYQALCSIVPHNNSEASGKERCLLTYSGGKYYLLGTSWVEDPGNSSLIDMEFTADSSGFSGDVWTDGQTVGTFVAE